MKVIQSCCTLLFLCFVLIAEPNQQITEMLSKVSGDSIWNNVDTLTTFERFTKESDAIKCTEYLQSLLQSYNYDIVSQQPYQSGYIPNVYAVKTGIIYPEKFLLIGAHYDSYEAGAAGADDNGSGTGSLMEIARVLENYQFEKSIVLVFYSGEEIGLLGSKHFSDSAKSNGLELESIINLDVIGFLKSGTKLEFDCSYNSASEPLYDTLLALMPDYLPEVSIADASNKTFWQSSDHASFWNNGYKGLFFAEELNRYSPDFNFNWHSDNDVLGTSCNSKELMAAVSKAAVMMTAHQANVVESENVLSNNKTIHTSLTSNVKLQGNSLTFDVHSSGDFSLSIVAANGRELLTKRQMVTPGSIALSTPDLAKGVYFVTTALNGQRSITKIIR